MRKIFVALSLFCALHLSAENVPQDKARQIAEDFLRQSRSRAGAINLRMVYDGESSLSRSSGDAPALYVFDNEGKNGFVIVSGDDSAYPILGYSYEGDFPEGQLPPNLESWLQGMKNQVNYLREQGAPTLTGSRAYTGEEVKKLNTALWNQDVPYNNETPVISGTKTPTGCTATATAIAMRYVKWPEKRTVLIPGYTTATLSVSVPGREVGEAYNWDNMTLEYNNQSTESQKSEVARLMADVGVMLKSDYKTGETAAYMAHIANALITYMDYDKSIMFRERKMFMQEDWYDLLKNEFDNNRPVIYGGYNEKAGHAFVLDGYTTENYFSVNWGWGGYCNGYFKLDAMVPSGSGIGGNNDHYNDGQNAVIGLKKNEGGTAPDYISFLEKGFLSGLENAKAGVEYSLKVDWILNNSTAHFGGTCLLALTDKDGAIKEELASFGMNLAPGYGYQNYEFKFKITKQIARGDRLRVFYQRAYSSGWTLITGGEECKWEIVLKEEVNLDKCISLSYERTTKKLIVNVEDDIEVKLLTEDGQDITDRLEKAVAYKYIKVNEFEPGTYILRLEMEELSRDLRLKLGVAQ